MTAKTAQKAVDRWHLERGRILYCACGCRVWVYFENDLPKRRRVYACEAHRY